MINTNFIDACNKIINCERQKNGIGTLSEKTLHAVLKEYFEPHKNNQEIKIGNYIADIVNENGIIEIQTRQFSRLIKKLDAFLEFSTVTVVYPVAKIKYISWIDMNTGELTKKRKSPKKGSIYNIIPELYKLKYTLDNPRLNFCICLLKIDETRYLNGWSKDRKKGSSRCDSVPSELFDEIYIKSQKDFKIFLPNNLDENFTSADFSKAAGISRSISQITLNLLNYLDIVKRVGKKSNSFIYKIVY